MAHVSTPAPLSIRPIRRLLVANRGEIARRIFRSAHQMGIATVAVYADGDANAPFVREADTAIALNGRSSVETYLDISKLLAACQRSGADAVHPGYGFLSENAAFAQAVIAAGLIWVGPPPAAIRGIGDKLAAKRVANELKILTLEAFELRPETDASAAAQRIGYPVLVKAAAGGGGRGMRVVQTPADLAAAIDSARREASTSFGDGTVFLERWLQHSRHVEIQILGDHHGQLVHLFERECSIQRRHQKIIEEAPSLALDDDLRSRMGEAAMAAARHIGYQSAGTVEFLVSGQEFFFLEVNTRLQVEHPVTEMITGLDLVREQLRIAEGEPLGYGQADVQMRGHAIEARLCAEDPANDFLPTPGTVLVWQPASGQGIRFDSGVESGSEIGIDFDPMIAKVIAHAPTRREAAAKLARALETTRIQGITHNRDFLVATLRTPEFLRGETHTDFIAKVAPATQYAPSADALDSVAIGVALHARALRRSQAKVLASIPGGFRNSHMPAERISYRHREATLAIRYSVNRDGSLAMQVNGQPHAASVLSSDVQAVEFTVDGQRHHLAVTINGDRRLTHGPAGDIELVELPRFPMADRAQFGGGLKAPMPGKVLAINVAVGDEVTLGQQLLILEAMKMEHRISAPTAGKIAALKVAAGDQVLNGALLVVFETGAPT